jgi:hypothetical protein
VKTKDEEEPIQILKEKNSQKIDTTNFKKDNKSIPIKLCMVVHTCNPSTWKVEAGGSGI